MMGFVGARGDHFIEYVTWSADHHRGDWPDGERLLRAYAEHLPNIVAFLLNKAAGEYQILVPARLSEAVQNAICDALSADLPVWSSKEYVDQNPRYVCSPKI